MGERASGRPRPAEKDAAGALPGQEQHERRGSIRQMRQGGKDASVRKPAMRRRRKAWRRVSHEGRRRNEGCQEDGARKAAQPMRRSTGDAAKTRRDEREPPRPRHWESRPARDLCSLSLGVQARHRRARGAKKRGVPFGESAAFLLCRRRSAIWPAARIRPRSRPDCRRDPPR